MLFVSLSQKDSIYVEKVVRCSHVINNINSTDRRLVSIQNLFSLLITNYYHRLILFSSLSMCAAAILYEGKVNQRQTEPERNQEINSSERSRVTTTAGLDFQGTEASQPKV